MYRLIHITMSLVIFTLAGCSPSSNPDNSIATSTMRPATQTPAPSPTKSPTPTITLPQIPTQIDSDLVIQMERQGCFGACPAYLLNIEANGTVTYEGIMYVRVEGIRRAWLNSSKMQELISAIESARFFEMEDRYYVGMTDLPSITLTITLDGRSKSVWHYGLICMDELGYAPMELCDLENLIDEITSSSQWVNHE